MEGLPVRLDGLGPAVENLMKIGGTPGLALSAIITAAVVILVEEGKLRWDTLVRDVLPAFHPPDKTLQSQLNITDLLSHRSGMSWADNLVIGTENNILISGKDGMSHINPQSRLLSFLGQFSYDNLPPDLAGYVIEHVNDQPFSEFVQTRILDPLGLDRTFLKPPPAGTDIVTTCYNAPRGRHLTTDLWPHIFQDRNRPAIEVQAIIDLNPGLSPGGMPIVGKGAQPQLVLFHQGSLPGALCAGMVLPDLDTIVIVLSNSLALNDIPGGVGQLALEEVLAVPALHRVDFLKIARDVVTENLMWYPAITKSLDNAQKKGTSPRDLTDYVGTYWSDSRIFKTVLTLESGKLYWAFQGLQSEKFRLNHYENNSFTWLLPRDELSRLGR
ncbi:beta-lactamase/transpeptidase-like protein [Immersiella caudata]|uniref:Beta-lactamase/transpeptidase-like protein n=1 Tax=Immersiella caudata TaxID=314043 RepID=A0AA39WIU8_9PEZI|nr:beta-lactamase/transpeptidase-like protein [Immersiella caudata]